MTIPTQLVDAPVIPGVEKVNEGMMIYEMPNNVSLPAYHRLDLGINFRKPRKEVSNVSGISACIMRIVG